MCPVHAPGKKKGVKERVLEPLCAALPALSSEAFLRENVHVWVEISDFHFIALCVLLDLDFLKVLGRVTISSHICGLSSEYKLIMGCEMSTLGLGCPCRG